ncbi:MAG: transglutaminase domain-containing protein [Candidatus Daviesbacteria bacterium]|nr:transglutaminase domain-containing protein [Candidatus Daviesbacteria bacterium]
MLKKVFTAILLFFLIFVPKAYAAEDFATSYDVVYDIGEDGVTLVTEKITLRNLTSQFYATDFKRTIGATQIFNIKASDASGNVQIDSTQTGTATNIAIKFGQQVVGLGKQFPWTLQYQSKDFATPLGKVWEISIPKVITQSQLDNFKITLAVPLSFGEPTLITPTPKTQTTNFGKMFLTFDKDQLKNTGVSATFGSNLVYDFNLTYRLQNDSLLPVLTSIALPPDTQYQDVIYQRIEPKPINVTIDSDGNYLAWYRLSRGQKQNVNVVGSAKLYIKSKVSQPVLGEAQRQKYLQSDKYWEVDNPAIKNKLATILRDNENSSNLDKAKLIYRYVVGFLKYDSSRLKDNPERLGAVTALSNQTAAVCMEFTDLFITLSRAAGIPARELDGFAYTTNPTLRPISLNSGVLHAWPEYWDDKRGWVMIDPTWESTTSGVDYFNQLDLNHFTFVVKGISSSQPIPAGAYKLNQAADVQVGLSSVDFLGKPQLLVDNSIPLEVVSGFPGHLVLTITNQGNALASYRDFSMTAQQLIILNNNQRLSPIPPFGHIDLQYEYRTKTFFDRFNDEIRVNINGQKFSKEFQAKPFFVFAVFPLALVLIVASMVGLYLAILGVLIYRRRLKTKLAKSPTTSKRGRKKV